VAFCVLVGDGVGSSIQIEQSDLILKLFFTNGILILLFLIPFFVISSVGNEKTDNIFKSSVGVGVGVGVGVSVGHSGLSG
jgi:hypothetical protein